ncbi:MAG: sugar ABC transporter substrate-binding protein [Clostridia bacterium]|nr:sugar ABC transporter substrate-binding protein [Clostridia bacterium]
MRKARSTVILIAAVLFLITAAAGCAADVETQADTPQVSAEAAEAAEATSTPTPEPVPESSVIRPDDPSAEEIAVTVAQTGSDALIQAAQAGGPVRVGLSVPSLADPYYAQVRDGVQAACDEHGYELVVTDATEDAAKQAQDLATFALEGTTAVIASPVDQAALEDAAAALNQAGTILVSFGTQSQDLDAPRFSGKQVPGANSVYVMREYDYGTSLGKNAATWIREKLGDTGNVLILTDDTSLPSYTRANGMMDAIMSTSSDSFIIDRVTATDRESGREAVAEKLAVMPEINVILATTDAAALGAQDAVREAGLPQETLDTIYIGGSGGSTDARADMASGESLIRATVNLAPQQVGINCVNAIANIIAGGSMPVKDAVMIAYWTPMAVTQESLTADSAAADAAAAEPAEGAAPAEEAAAASDAAAIPAS